MSRQGPKNQHAVKVVKKSTLFVVPKQGTVVQVVVHGMADGRPQGETFNVEEKEWVQVNRKRSLRLKRYGVKMLVVVIVKLVWWVEY